MSLLGGILGHGTEVSREELEKDISPLLVPDEKIDMGFKLIRDLFVFTDKRLILVDKQGMTGHKKEYISVPYHSVSHFSIESAGHFDMDSELRIWVRGVMNPIKKEIKKDANILAVQKALATHILRK